MRTKIKFIPGNRAGIKEDPAKEGIIEVRPGTKGIDLGDKKYEMAYIRVLDENHYFKGMCIYSDDLPEGYDVICYYLNPMSGLNLFESMRPNPSVKLSSEIMTKIPCDLYGWAEYHEKLRGRITNTFLNRR